jgi:hypothetical protein
MITMNSKYAYTLAVVLGLTIPFIPEMKPFPIILGIIYLFGGSLFGFLWPKESWRWGVWIVGPIIVLMGLSVLFAGQLDIFLNKDLPILLFSMICACSGSLLLARFKNSRIKVIEK